MNFHDLHNHTSFSYDGSNTPEEIIENALSNGIRMVGITDHQFSIGANIKNYISYINQCKEKYENKITVLCGLEIGTRPKPDDFLVSYSEQLDYCLFESIDSLVAMDFYEFLEWTRNFKCPVGLAHTDIFSLEQRYDIDIFTILKRYDLFWEINTSGNYTYYYDFITNKEKQERVKNSNIKLSVGSDTHWVGEYSANKIHSVHKLIEKLNNPLIF